MHPSIRKGNCFAHFEHLNGSATSDRNSELPTESGTSNFALGLPQLLGTDGYDSETKFRFRSVIRSSGPILPIRSDIRNEQKKYPTDSKVTPTQHMFIKIYISKGL